METALQINGTSQLVTTAQITADLEQRFIDFLDVASPKTLKTYQFGVHKLFEYFRAHNITHPNRQTMKEYKQDLREKHSASTVNICMTAARRFFSWTDEDIHAFPNIIRDIKGEKISRETHRTGYLSEEQERKLLSVPNRETLTGKRDYALIRLMLTTGIRCHTASLANIGDLKQHGSALGLDIQNKGHATKDNYVKIAPKTEAAVLDYLKARGETKPTAPLFASESFIGAGSRITPQSISRIIKENLRKAGIDTPFITAHSLRHTAGTQSAKNGVPVEEIREMLGHSNINTTMIYINAARREKNNTENLLDSLLD